MKLNRIGTRFVHSVVAFAVVVSASTELRAQAPQPWGHYAEHSFKEGDHEHKYMVFVPAAYRSDKPTPTIMFLHGAGERGNENRMQLANGLAPFVQARSKTFPFLVVYPQADFGEGRILDTWNGDQPGGRQALAALEDAQKRYNVDTKRVVLTGWSMGGYGVWNLGMAEPQRWSALIPISGGGDPGKVAALKDVPVWAFHGANDSLIKADSGRATADALKDAGGKVTYTELTDGSHDVSAETYGDDALVRWMLDPKNAPTVLGTSKITPLNAVNVPFVPALEISHAVGLRLGNEVLDALSYSIPHTISPDLLTGRLDDMFDSTVASGRQFSIRFGGISYTGQLERVATRGYGKDRLLVQLGVRNITVTIGGTSVTGARHSAQAGPIAIRIGQQYPVWFNLELTPYIADKRIRMRLIGASFQIPNDNWSVSQPAGVSVHGFGMTQEAVVSGLTNGLYGAKGRIENAVVSIAPRIVQEIEKSLTLPDTSASVAKLWPLPVYPPRIVGWPQQITTDEHGISLVIGATVGSLEPYGPHKPLKQVSETAISTAQLPTDKLMHVVIAPNVLEPLTQLLVDSNQVKLDLLDIPEPAFAKLAGRDTLLDIIPDLKQYGDALQVRSTMRFLKPISITNPKQAAATDGSKPVEFQMPEVQVTVSIKTSSDQTKWQPCAVFNLNLSEQVTAKLEKPAHDLRVINLDLLPASKVTGSGQLADGYDAKNKDLLSDKYVEQFGAAWSTYSSKLNDASTEIPDLTIGLSKLRMSDMKWDLPTIDATYHLARIKLTNLSKEPVIYQTKSPTSPWGPEITLKPEGTHEFEIPYPLTYRRVLPTGPEIYTLNVGSNSEFRTPVTGGVPRLFTARRPPREAAKPIGTTSSN